MLLYTVTRLDRQHDHSVQDGDYSASDLRVFTTPEEAAKYIVDLEAQAIQYGLSTEPGIRKAIIDAVHLENEKRLLSLSAPSEP